MPADLRPPVDCVTTVTGELANQFAGLLPYGVVAAEVVSAERDLRGQVAPAALAEFLHRLAEHRLRERVPASSEM